MTQATNQATNIFYYHRAALALNNIGIALSERFAPNEAYQAFKDAVWVMKSIFLFMEKGEPLPKEEEVAGRLAHANHKMATITGSPSLQSDLDIMIIRGHDELLSLSMDIPSIISEANRDGHFFLMGFDTGVLDCIIDQTTMELQSLVILNNFAVSNFILLRRAVPGTDNEKLRSNTLSLFTYTYAILCKNPHLFNTTSIWPQVVVMGTAMLILSNFAVVLNESGRINDVTRLRTKIVELDKAMNERLVADITFDSLLGAAPAA